jgi:Glycine radical
MLNQKFLPDFLKTETGITSLVALIRSYFKIDGHHIQFNVVDKMTLQKSPAAPGKLSGSYCAGGRVFRLFCGPHPGTSTRDHSSNRL